MKEGRGWRRRRVSRRPRGSPGMKAEGGRAPGPDWAPPSALCLKVGEQAGAGSRPATADTVQSRLLGCTWGSEGQVGTSILEVLQKLVLTVRLLVPVNLEKDMRALSGRSGCREWRRRPRGQHRFYLQRFPGAEGSGIQGGPGWLLSTPAVRKQGWGRESTDLGAMWAEAEGKPERREQQQER